MPVNGNHDKSYAVARILLDNGMVELRPEDPFTYAAGGKGPIYCDNRRLFGYHQHRRAITEGFVRTITTNSLRYDVIAGTATAAIPWAAWVADILGVPMIYVRGAAKEHGRQNRIEGILKAGQRVILIEDLINTGGSSISSINAIREAGGIVDSCLAIVDYDLQESTDAFERAKCALYALTGLEILLDVAVESSKLLPAQRDLVLRWQKDPKNWARKEGFA